MDLIMLLMKITDPYAIVIAVVLTQIIRNFLPTPSGGTRFDVTKKWYRILPIIPLIIGTLVVILKDGIITPTIKLDDAIVKGFCSGVAAAYLYKTGKVVIFGKKNGNDKLNEKIGGGEK